MTKFIFSSFIIVFTICFFNTGATFAQDEMEDVVYFEDGAVVRGKILELNTTRVIIETKGGQKINRSFKEVRTISEEKVTIEVPLAVKTKPIYDKGIEGKHALGARLSHVSYKNDEYSVYGVTVNVEPEDAVMFGINFTYFINKYFSFELSVDYAKTDIELSALGLSGNAGEVTQVPVLFTGRTHLSSNPKVNPYLSIGVGYFFNDINSNHDTIEFIYGQGAIVSVDNSFGFLLGGGVEFFVSEKTAFNLDLKYIWTEVEAEVNKSGFTKEDFEINPLVIGLGIKYYF